MVLKFKRLHEVKFSNGECVPSCGQMSPSHCIRLVLVLLWCIRVCG